MLGLIYIITNLINNKVYIGQTIQTLEKRWQGHCRKSCSKNEADMQIKRAIYKYGKENFTIKVIEECNVDKKTVKHILEINNISIRTSRTYKLSSEDRKKIIEESSYMNRKDLMSRWSISKSYLSQLLSGKRRI